MAACAGPDPGIAAFPIWTRHAGLSRGFGQPVRQVFEPFFFSESRSRRLRRSIPGPLPGPRGGPVLVLAIPSRRPRRRARHGAGPRFFQRGRISVYLMYSFRDPAFAAACFVRERCRASPPFTEPGLAVLLRAAADRLGQPSARAWLQNKYAPASIQPYARFAKLFQKESHSCAQSASSLFRSAPYLIFGSRRSPPIVQPWGPTWR